MRKMREFFASPRVLWFVPIGVVAFVFGYLDWAEAEDFRDRGVETVGTVASNPVESCSSGEGGESCHWEASIEYSPESFPQMTLPGVHVPKNAIRGSAIRIFYLSDDPSVVRVGDPSDDGPFGWAGMVVGVTLVLVGFGVFGYNRWKESAVRRA